MRIIIEKIIIKVEKITKKNTIKINWPTVGNNHITDYLEKSLAKDDLSGVYIFSGPDNLGKTTLANIFAKAVLCQDKEEGIIPCGKCASCASLSPGRKAGDSFEEADLGVIHGDLHLIKKEKDKKNISIEQIREFIRKLNLSSFLNSYKIGIIKHAHCLSDEAANALLKTLEEPRDKVIIILVTSKIETLPGTIISRAKIFNFKQAPKDVIYDFLIKNRQAPRSAAKNFSHMCLGRYALAIKFLEDKDFHDEYLSKVNIFINFMNQNIIDRINAVETLFKSEDVGQEISARAGRTIEVWNGVIRDLILLEYNLKDLVQHEIALDDLMKIKEKINFRKLIDINLSLDSARKQLGANVNPRLVLENVAVNI